VTIGTPPVQFSVTVDTGSSDFFVRELRLTSSSYSPFVDAACRGHPRHSQNFHLSRALLATLIRNSGLRLMLLSLRSKGCEMLRRLSLGRSQY
jgi:hypothetical protein